MNNNILYIEEYDLNGKLIYRRDSNGFEQWVEYDNKGNLIHYKNSDGYEAWYTPNGTLIYQRYNFSRPWNISISMALLSIRNMLANMIHGLKRMLNKP